MNELHRSIFSGMQILTDQRWEKDQAVIVEGSLIKAIIPVDMIKHHLPARRREFSSDCYLIPGLIDLHVHGAKGCDVMDASEEALITIAHALAAEGVTGFLATTMTADNDRIKEVLTVISKTMRREGGEGAAILGVHLEGPFIAKAKKGAQSGDAVQLPDPKLMRRLQEVAQDAIKIVTLAPELPGAIPFIQTLQSMKIIASIGHTNATYAETCAAIAAGCSQATHLFNAMSGMQQREPGVVGALLLSDQVTAELIVDGTHLHPAIVELSLRLKRKERLLLVTDAMRAKCLGDGRYELGGRDVDVSAGKVTLHDGTLAGSTLRMPQAIKNMVKFSQCSLIDAISMAAHNPARVLKLDSRKGSINVGKDADLVVLNADFDVVLSMREGREIYYR
jgi:N-acetylglucosamine-6-phosphate deacetylase